MEHAGISICADRLFDGEVIRGPSTLEIAAGRMTAIRRGKPRRRSGCEVLPVGALLAPGFIDLQVNGGGGVLFNDTPTAATIARIAAAHRPFGTTGFLVTLISDERAKIRSAIKAVAAAMRAGQPGLLGIHIEGPFLNLKRRGVHPASRIAEAAPEDIEVLAGLGPTGTTLVTLAPEKVPVGFIAALVQRGVIVAAGHTEASAADIARARGEGLTGATHLFNAMSQMTAREPGAVGACLADDRIFAGLIADLHHVAPAPLRVALKAKGAARLCLVTDAMPPAGSSLDRFELFGEMIRVEGGRATTPSGTLAGSVLTMDLAVRQMQLAAGASESESLAMATSSPAAFLGQGGRRGRLAKDYVADLVALDREGNVLATWIAGSRQASEPTRPQRAP
jgi:N-acetylglucosamine-6-phosphate deacetylase